MNVSHVHPESGEPPTPPEILNLLVPHHPKARHRAQHPIPIPVMKAMYLGGFHQTHNAFLSMFVLGPH